MEHICKNCKYVEDTGLQYECNCPKFVYTSFTLKTLRNTDCLGYYDCDGYGAGFEVGENFGCIHWKSKECGE